MSPRPSRLLVVAALSFTLLLAGCALRPELREGESAASVSHAAPCPVCEVCPVCKPTIVEPPPAAPPFAAARWDELPNWPGSDGLGPSFQAFLASCQRLTREPAWQAACAAAGQLDGRDEATLRAWFEAHLQPWQLVNPDGSRSGLITGYYEPLLKASRVRKAAYRYPIYAVPDDLIEVDLAGLYPELRHMRLRGRLEGNRLVPYWSRAEWEQRQEKQRDNRAKALVWADDAIDVFFLQIQGSGQVQLDDGSRIRVGYANQNGHPYRSIGRWLLDQGELKPGQASMQGIRNWVKNNPARAQELLDTNPSYVFFRELPVVGDGPPGAMGLALTPERSIAIDPRITPLGVPVWLDTTYPNSEQPLTRLMVAQDTGGAIRGPVRADFYWGSGQAAGAQAGKMSQQGRMWVLLPNGMMPPASAPTR
ncbi:MltA domain protein [Sterolibacterium denitrificans]|uniref:peptidoglycan lytic exotransglycosylase n=1 Tax=Sterolibacterium denitrificans TaxID=157592 RepID=A0A7Z7HQ01_9PROT|nr:MltA domain-containing protein [Sterolibacterium denitrificans]SMB22745.1 MltA domain protein [Sterolibacterium denitrificans]